MRFKYISCSYLSFFSFFHNTKIMIFKYISCSYLSDNRFSNSRSKRIQIHLMFLFIISVKKPESCTCSFKYISCSYLSQSALRPLFLLALFKYISCSYLSPLHVRIRRRTVFIQIHLMFLFICRGFICVFS